MPLSKARNRERMKKLRSVQPSETKSVQPDRVEIPLRPRVTPDIVTGSGRYKVIGGVRYRV